MCPLTIMPISYQKREGKTVYFDNQIMVFHFPACLVLANGRPLCFVFFFPLLPGRVHKSKGRNLKKKCRRDHNRCCSCHSSLKSGCSMVVLWFCPWVVALVQMISHTYVSSILSFIMTCMSPSSCAALMVMVPLWPFLSFLSLSLHAKSTRHPSPN